MADLERVVKVDVVPSGKLQGRAGVVPCLLQPLEPPPEDGLVLEHVDLILNLLNVLHDGSSNGSTER